MPFKKSGRSISWRPPNPRNGHEVMTSITRMSQPGVGFEIDLVARCAIQISVVVWAIPIRENPSEIA